MGSFHRWYKNDARSPLPHSADSDGPQVALHLSRLPSRLPEDRASQHWAPSTSEPKAGPARLEPVRWRARRTGHLLARPGGPVVHILQKAGDMYVKKLPTIHLKCQMETAGLLKSLSICQKI